MSNALAIAHVSQALALLIENNLLPEIDMAVSVETRKPPPDPPADPTINVFLYQVTPNVSLRNSDLITRASDGTLLKRAVAALDLHYVISAYGEENELVGQRLIGSVVRTLHEIPILPRDVIETAGQRPYLAGSDLLDSPQHVRFTPQVMDVDETSKLWGMLYQTPYALSVVYTATLVLIDGRERPVDARPVERSSVRVLPFGAPPGATGSGDGARDGAPGGGEAGAPRTGAPGPARKTTAGKPPARPRKATATETAKKSASRTTAKRPPKATSKATSKTTSKAAAQTEAETEAEAEAQTAAEKAVQTTPGAPAETASGTPSGTPSKSLPKPKTPSKTTSKAAVRRPRGSAAKGAADEES